MRIVRLIILAFIALLSIAAGAAKLMMVPQEMAFFESLGVDLTLMVVFGVFQIVGGIFLFVPKVRKVGATIVAAAFIISAIMIFMTGQTVFGLTSLIPAIVALYLVLSRQAFATVKKP